MGNQKTIHELIEFAVASMEQTGYSEGYILSLSYTWNALKQHMYENDIPCFSTAAGTAFLEDRYNITSGCNYFKLSGVDKRRKRAILILNNCLEHEKLKAPKSYLLCKFASQFETKFQKFTDMRSKTGLSISTLNRDIFCLNKLSSYLDSMGIQSLKELESAHIVGFMKHVSLSGKLPTLDGAASSLRLVLKFLFTEHDLSTDLSLCVPKVRNKPDGIPSVYSKEEIQQLLNGIDRASPKGKRDYAMILLAARLGMRSSDICGLLFENLKWQTSTIEFIVKKTGKSAVLPLLNEVGEAIIEHIKYGRPDSEDKHVFVRLQVPFVEMKPSILHNIVRSSLRNAKIALPPGKRCGPHALRASLASAMLENNTPMPVISEALTHTCSDTTKIYLKIDLQHLREYSLEVIPLGNIWMGGVGR